MNLIHWLSSRRAAAQAKEAAAIAAFTAPYREVWWAEAHTADSSPAAKRKFWYDGNPRDEYRKAKERFWLPMPTPQGKAEVCAVGWATQGFWRGLDFIPPSRVTFTRVYKEEGA